MRRAFFVLMQNSLNSLCIVGGGTAGWMAASVLSSALQGSGIKITVIESPDIASVGVGESTVPSILDFLRACRIDLNAFIKATSASFKLGIRFDDWREVGEHYFHPFGRVGQDINGFEFYQAWLKTLSEGQATRWLDQSPGAIMAEHSRFMLRPPRSNDWALRHYSYALHLDAVLVARYLRDLCLARGVARIEATVNDVAVDDRQFIRSVSLDSGARVTSDFYIDCTGFRGRLIDRALNVGYRDWSDYLPCDRAVVVQTRNTEDPVPYTQATARAAGWSWRIPLQHRTGNGYVFSSRHCSDDQAIQTLLTTVKGEVLNEPRVIPFVTGRREKIWHHNCLALGLASGFLEPLESTAIHLVYKTLIHFIRHFPDRDFDPGIEQAFNRKINTDYREIRDFIILHYCTAGRRDTPFWQNCQNLPVPDSLREKIRRFRERGELESNSGDFFSRDSWCSIFEGMNIRPRKYHPLMDAFDSQRLAAQLRQQADHIRTIVMKMPSHGDYIRQHCGVESRVRTSGEVS